MLLPLLLIEGWGRFRLDSVLVVYRCVLIVFWCVLLVFWCVLVVFGCVLLSFWFFRAGRCRNLCLLIENKRWGGLRKVD